MLPAPAGTRVDAPPSARNTLVHQLKLRFDGSLRVLRQDPPWKVVRAFGPLVHLHNVSGGILSGDRLSLEVDVAAPMQITTTGATRLYRHRPGAEDSEQRIDITIADGATLEYLPDALIPFKGSRHAQRTKISIGRGATLFAWETLAFTFDFEYLRISTAIDMRGTPAVREDFVLEPAKRPLTSPARLEKSTHLSSFLVLSEGKTSDFWSIMEYQLREIAPKWGVTTLSAGGVLARAPFQSTELLALWDAASQLVLGTPAVPPRKVY